MEAEEKIFLSGKTYEQTVAINSQRFPFLIATATYDNGRIIKKVLLEEAEEERVQGLDNKVSKRKKRIIYNLCLVGCYALILLLGFLGTWTFKNSMFSFFTLMVIIDVIVYKTSIPTYIYETIVIELSGFEQSKGFHAAEHKVINAFNKKQSIPTMEEVNKATMFSPNCSSCCFLSEQFHTYISYFLCGLNSYENNFWNMILKCSVIMILLTIVCKKFKPHKYLSIVSLKEPKQYELETAMAALELWQEIESTTDNELISEWNEMINQYYFNKMLNRFGICVEIKSDDFQKSQVNGFGIIIHFVDDNTVDDIDFDEAIPKEFREIIKKCAEDFESEEKTD